jgi:hypothetical protein
MKKCIVIILLLPLLSVGQEKKDFEFNFISLNPISGFRAGGNGGFAISGDVGFSFKENLFMLSAQFAQEFAIFTDYLDSFSEVNLSWGKEFVLADWLQSDFFVGLSYFYFKEGNVSIRGHDRTTTVGVPLTSKFKFMLGDHFAMGPQIRFNLNNVQTIMSLGVAFQVDF